MLHKRTCHLMKGTTSTLLINITDKNTIFGSSWERYDGSQKFAHPTVILLFTKCSNNKTSLQISG